LDQNGKFGQRRGPVLIFIEKLFSTLGQCYLCDVTNTTGCCPDWHT